MGLVNWFSRLGSPPKPSVPMLPERVQKVTPNKFDRAMSRNIVDLITSSVSSLGDEEASSIAKACVRKVAVSAASVPLLIYDQTGEDAEVVTFSQHPILRLIDSPNIEQSRAEFVMQCMQQVQRNGRCIVVCIRGEDGEMDLVVADYPDVSIEVDEYESLLYTVQWPEPLGERVYRESDIIDWKLPSTTGGSDPEGPWQIAVEELEGDGNARKWQHVSMIKRLLPDGIFKLPSGTPTSVVEDFKRQVEGRSGNENARQTLVTTGDVDFQSLSSPPAEADFIETRKFYRNQICSVFGVPPPVLGFMENATLANLDASKVMMWEDTVIPYLDMFCGALTTFINNEFEGLWAIKPDISTVPALRQRVLESAQAASVLRAMGVPFDVINERLGLGVGQFDGDDVGVLDANKMPLKDVLGIFDIGNKDGY